MDGIQKFHDATSRVPAHATHSHAVNPTIVKSTSDYMRALRRRIWLVLAVAIPLSVGAAVYTMRMPAVYRAAAQIHIEAPEFDPILAMLVSKDVGKHDPSWKETYVPTKLAQLKSKSLVERVLLNPEFARNGPPSGDAAQEILENLQARQVPNSTSVLVTLEGTDPERTAKLLYALLERLRDQAKDESAARTDLSKRNAVENLNRQRSQLEALEQRLASLLQNSKVIGPGGTNLMEEIYRNHGLSLMQRQAQFEELQKQILMSQYAPRTGDRASAMKEAKLAQLLPKQEKLESQLDGMLRTTRKRKTDPAIRVVAEKLDRVIDQIVELESAPLTQADSPILKLFETMGKTVEEDIRKKEEQRAELLAQVRESSGEHQAYAYGQEERKHKLETIRDLDAKIGAFDTLQASVKDSVQIPDSVSEPMIPVRPKRAVFIVMGLILSFGLAIGMVCMLEHFDHSVKMPEHLSIGLTLPLFGVVPRIRRTALTHRGGHLWTPGAPESVEADAYRNLRASLLGATDRIGPITTLLVTSAKAGEGKSTTALNLAATCARAGERTLLMDVDLRRPSLNGVFEHEGPEVGLVDVLSGSLPWQSTLVRTGLANLDFIPTGDTREIPIEILGTLELRQLLIAVSGHYDRVILDGPAILGMADCRMLGRVVDAALLVVRSGSHGLSPLLRAKSMLEQSRVTIAGVVFNGLYEDLQNWSSYGPYEPYGTIYRGSAAARLEAPADEPVALTA